MTKSLSESARWSIAAIRHGSAEQRFRWKSGGKTNPLLLRREFQRQLRETGFYDGPYNGVIDSRTKTALDRLFGSDLPGR